MRKSQLPCFSRVVKGKKRKLVLQVMKAIQDLRFISVLSALSLQRPVNAMSYPSSILATVVNEQTDFLIKRLGWQSHLLAVTAALCDSLSFT